MYVPHFGAILKNIGLTKEQFEAASSVNVPTPLLQFLLQLVVAGGDFNKTGYLAENADIADAMMNGSLVNPRLHYIQFGFFEGRTGATPDVDESWYLKTYEDVGHAVRTGDLSAGSEHFISQGAAEGRAPNEHAQLDALQWKAAFGL